jgi:Beta-propeller repeat
MSTSLKHAFTIIALFLAGSCGEQTNSSVMELNDSTLPTIGQFVVNNNEIITTQLPISFAFNSADDFEVTAYYLSETDTKPTGNDPGWIGVTQNPEVSVSTDYDLSAASGCKPIYAWVKDSSEQVSETAKESIYYAPDAWIQELSTGFGHAIKQDATGELLIVGNTNNDLYGESGKDSDFFIARYSTSSERLWTRQFASAGVLFGAADQGSAMALNASGEIYITGYVSGDFNYDTHLGSADLLVSKHNSSGLLMWSYQGGSYNNDRGMAIALGSGGQAYVTGYTEGMMSGYNKGKKDIFLVEVSGGVNQWIRQVGTAYDESGEAVAVDSAGNIYIAGYTKGGLDSNVNQGAEDYFISKYNSSGTHQWTVQAGTEGSDEVTAMAFGSSGALFVAGQTSGDLEGNLNQGSTDAFIAKYNTNGEHQWTKLYGTTETEQVADLTFDEDENIYLSGFTYGEMEGSPLQGDKDIFVLKADSAGNLLNTWQLGDSTSNQGVGLAVDAGGHIYVLGTVTVSDENGIRGQNSQSILIKIDNE